MALNTLEGFVLDGTRPRGKTGDVDRFFSISNGRPESPFQDDLHIEHALVAISSVSFKGKPDLLQ